jgi:ribosomal protein L11
MLKGSSTNRENVGSVTIEQVKEIATIKMADLNTDNMDKAILIISANQEKL